MKRIPKTNLESPYLKVLAYGEPGSGKTRFVSSAALDERSSPALMLEAGGNPLSVRDYAKAPDIIHLESLADLNVPYEWLSTGQKPDHPFCQKMELTPPYKTVILDSITEIQRMSFRFVTGNTTTGPGTIPQPTEIQHFGRVLAQMVTLANLYFGLSMHVLMTTLERYDKDEVTGAYMLRPLLWGQSASEVGGYAYAVARMVHRARLDNKLKMDLDKLKSLTITEDPVGEQAVSVALFTPTGKYIAKDQYGAFGAYMTNPTVTKLLDAMQAGSTPL